MVVKKLTALMSGEMLITAVVRYLLVHSTERVKLLEVHIDS